MEDSGISLPLRQLNSELRYEFKRLETFNTWPIESPIESARIAKAGFFYTGKGYEVQCFACSGKITSWNYGDQAVSKHRTMNPSCPFILNRSSNVPLHSQSEQMVGSPSNINSLMAITPSANSSSHQIPLQDSVQSEQQIDPDEYGGDVLLMNVNLNISTSNINSIQPESTSTSFTTVDGNDSSRPLLADVAVATSSPERVDRMTVPPNVVNQSQSSRSLLSHQDWAILKREHVRLRTFDERFSATFLSPLVLAKTGFFYLGVADVVQCAFCRGVVKDWEINDDPRQEHQRLFPSCAFILGLPVGNVPVGTEELADHSALGRTVSFPNNTNGNGMEMSRRFSSLARPNASPDTEIGPSNNMQLSALIVDNLEQLGITKHSGPRYTNYSTFESRIKSFKNWPSHLKQTPSIMAQAGFFYLGTSDHVSCFSCGSGLRNWETDDDPWMEHARWFPECRFLCLMKGEQYIKEASESMPTSNFGASCSKSKAPSLPLIGSSPSFPREVSEAELERTLLDSPIAQTVLAMGVDISRVKQAFQFKLRATGSSFTTVDSLLEAAIEAQHYSEHRQALEERNYETVEWPAAVSTQQSGSESLFNDASNAFTLPEERKYITTNLYSPTGSVRELNIDQRDTTNTVEEKSMKSESQIADYDRTQILEEEIRKLKEARLCKVCLDEDMAIAFVPCGHLVTCFSCAAALDNCPLCRKKIKGTVRIFFS